MKELNELQIKMDIAERFSRGRNEPYHAVFLREQLKLLEYILGGGEYYVATYYVPGELVSVFDIPVLYLERMSGFAAANKIIKDLSIKRMMLEMPSCGCSYQLIFESMIEEGILPPPSGFIATSYACDDAWMYCRRTAKKHNVDFYFIDTVQDLEEALVHTSSQLKELYEKLAKKHKVKRTIKEIVGDSNDAIRIKTNIDKLRIKYPGIVDSIDSFKLFTLYNDLGKDTCVSIFKNFYEKILEDTKNYEKIECPKIIWLGVIPLFKNRFIKDIEKKYNCRIVYEDLFDYQENYLSEDSFFIDISKRIMSSIFFTVDKRVNSLLSCIKKFKPHGIIHFSQKNCKFLPSIVPVLRNKLSDIGIPIVEIHGDAVDSHGFSESSCYRSLEPFFEMVQRRYDV